MAFCTRSGSKRERNAGVVELADTRDLGSRDESRGGSSPSARTTAREFRTRDWGIAMQVNEIVSEPLHREFAVVIGATDLDAKLTGKLTEIQPKVHLKGFRPGKAPVSFLKKTYGKSLMATSSIRPSTRPAKRH